MGNAWDVELIKFGSVDIRTSHLMILFLILLGTRILLWAIRRLIKRKSSLVKLDSGRSMAAYQIIKYFIVVIAIVLGLDVIGVKITILLAGSAALLVGVGLGAAVFQ